MPTDRYTKLLLTVIATALTALAVENAMPRATAQQPGPACSVLAPCYVTNTGITPLSVVDTRAAQQQQPSQPLHGIPPKSGQMKK